MEPKKLKFMSLTKEEQFLTEQGLWNYADNINLSRKSLLELLSKYRESLPSVYKIKDQEVSKKFAEWTSLLQLNHGKWYEENNSLFAESTDELFEKFTQSKWFKKYCLSSPPAEKELKDITDEDKIEVAKILKPNDEHTHNAEYGGMYVKQLFNGSTYTVDKCFALYKFLTNRGYKI